MSTRPPRIVEEFFDALSRADVAKLDELYADDFELWTAGSLPFSGTKTRAEALAGMRMVATLFPTGLAFTVLATTCEGDRIAIEAESQGTAASGRRYHQRYHFLMELRGSRIRRFKEYMDTLHAQEVMVDSMSGVVAEEAG